MPDLPVLRRLAAFKERLEAPGFDFGQWDGSEKLADGSTTMPYFSYSAEALELLGSMPIRVFDWTGWMKTEEAQSLLADYSRIASATPEQLTKLCTSLKRSDRFNEGTLAWAFESGLLLAIVRRAAALADE